jgi:hypothetical protein
MGESQGRVLKLSIVGGPVVCRFTRWRQHQLGWHGAIHIGIDLDLLLLLLPLPHLKHDHRIIKKEHPGGVKRVQVRSDLFREQTIARRKTMRNGRKMKIGDGNHLPNHSVLVILRLGVIQEEEERSSSIIDLTLHRRHIRDGEEVEVDRSGVRQTLQRQGV